jgi:hypothetical protein
MRTTDKLYTIFASFYATKISVDAETRREKAKQPSHSALCEIICKATAQYSENGQ